MRQNESSESRFESMSPRGLEAYILADKRYYSKRKGAHDSRRKVMLDTERRRARKLKGA
jgi:hypothetical protein